MILLYVTVALLVGCVATPVFADNRIDAKLRCQMEFSSASEQDIACERGVDLASRAGDQQQAINGCSQGTQDAARVAACQRGVALHTGVADRARSGDKSSRESTFSYSWKEGPPTAQVEIGDFQARVGDARKQIDACMRAYEGSSTPPSCMAGITVQRKPPAAPPLSTQPP